MLAQGVQETQKDAGMANVIEVTADELESRREEILVLCAMTKGHHE